MNEDNQKHSVRNPIYFVVTDTNQEETLRSFREKHAPELTASQVSHRYSKLGQPKRVSIEQMTIDPRHGGQNETIIHLGKALISMGDIARMCNKANGVERSVQFYFSRWRAIGMPKKIKTLKWFLMAPVVFKETRRQNKKRENDTSTCDLSHIPKGDLAHLSDVANYGRGKGEIPDQEWIGRIGSRRASSYCQCSLSFPGKI